jgi:deazaflavin-dependent oxidoreductase (nitroreductase family)
MAIDAGPDRGSHSRGRRQAFRVLFFLAPYRLVAPISRRMGFLPYVDVRIPGRKTGLERRTMVTLIKVGDSWYIGHPNGRSQWVRNLQAAQSAVVFHKEGETAVRPVELQHGDEREMVIKATAHQPPPAGLLYFFSRSHIRASGSYFRLERIQPEGLPPPAS